MPRSSQNRPDHRQPIQTKYLTPQLSRETHGAEKTLPMRLPIFIPPRNPNNQNNLSRYKKIHTDTPPLAVTPHVSWTIAMTLPRLYPILDTDSLEARGIALQTAAAAFLEGGAGILQIRHKRH